MFLLVDNFDSFTYNLYALFINSGEKVKIVKNNQYINADKFRGIILSPGPSSPENSGTTLLYLKNYAKIKPILGVCLGMQAIGSFLGYQVTCAKNIMHGKIDKISILKEKVLFNGLNDFKSVRYHSLVVNTSVENNNVTAISTSDKEVMAIENIELNLFGVQFHPESFLSENGAKIIKNFINYTYGGI